MDPFGYEMAADAIYGAGIPNFRVPSSPVSERYELRIVRRRYLRRGTALEGRGLDHDRLRVILDEMEAAVNGPDPVDTPVFVMPKTVKRNKRKATVPVRLYGM